jgi:SAM-dependent methyltransferase
MDDRTIEYYDLNAPQVASRYGTDESPGVALIKRFVPSGSRVLDIGAGSGRDLFRLLQAGYDAVGLEPSRALRSEAIATFGLPRERIIPGGLPDPPELGKDFIAILLSAVIQHVADAEMEKSLAALKRLLADGGFLLLLHPGAHSGIDPQSLRNPEGRLFILREASEYRRLMAGIGLEEISCERRPDRLGRSDVNWIFQVFRLPLKAGRG